MKMIKKIKMKKLVGRLILVMAFIALNACATTSNKETEMPVQPAASAETLKTDPFENTNRKIFAFNEKFDENILTPLSRGYRVLPRPIRIAIFNFFSNTAEGRNLINSLLQGKLKNSVDSFSRLFINSTLGLFGLIDIATLTGLKRHVEDVGQTLAVWGFGFGPYVVIPIIGSSSGRDIFGLYSYFFYTDPLGYMTDTATRFSLLVLDMVDTRSRYLRASSVFSFASLDPYQFARESYFQQRLDFIYDGRPPIENYE
ncbi:MAG TPA: VacJ family lipoprotein [Gammaproteobacteria bacterium]|nr:VacJ family lipoprotein [Gammaproteobacteria bacterium]